MENQIIHTLKSIWLCIKYPFLYPRNRWNGLHYNNWRFEEKINGRRSLNSKPMIQKEGWFQKGFIINVDQETYKSTTEVKNWWYAMLYYIGTFIYHYPMQWLHCIPTYTEWDAMNEGWRKAFGKQYLKELKQQLKKDKCLYTWRILDLKEKYGTLRLYCNFGSNELYDIIQKYEDLSYETCIKCGKPATIITDGYILPYCDECYNKNIHKPFVAQRKIDGKWVDEKERVLV